jgi:hypothetical protein
MSAAVQPIVTFRGTVRCERNAQGPLGLILTGCAEEPDEAATVAFSGQAPGGLPQALEGATLERLDGGHYRIRSGRSEWVVAATAAHLHREVGPAFYRAVPPRAPRWTLRLFWRVVLALAQSPRGRRLLLTLRRRPRRN